MRRCALAALGFAAAHAAAMGPGAPFTPAQPAEIDAARGIEVAGPGLTGLRLHNHPLALVDGVWVRVGDRVRNAEISAIGADGAQLRHADGRIELLRWDPRTFRHEPVDPNRVTRTVVSRTSPP